MTSARVALVVLVAACGGLVHLSADPPREPVGPLPDPGPAEKLPPRPPEATAAEFEAVAAAYRAVGGNGNRETLLRVDGRAWHTFWLTPTADRCVKLPDPPFEYLLVLRVQPDTAPGALAPLARLQNLRRLVLEVPWEPGPDGRVPRVDLAGPVTELAGVSNLEVLRLSRGTDAAVAALRGLRSLRDLTVDGPFTDAALEGLARQPSLERVTLSGSPNITDAGLAHLARLPRLRALDVRYCDRITTVGVRPFATPPRLRELAVGGPGVGADVLLDIGRIGTLEELNLFSLRGPWEVTGFSPEQLAALARLPRLRTVGYRTLMTDAGLEALARAPRL
ncbi:hypothetical protein J0H58_11160 [bacterium]|nr:hypothetical protein [bacterium]